MLEGVLHFPDGLPGFEDLTRFFLIQDEELLPIVFLSAAAEPRILFPVAPIRCLEPDYELRLGEDDCRLLDLTDPPCLGSNLLCLAIVTVGEGDRPATANLFAPLVVNLNNGRAKQVIQFESSYSAVFEI